MMHSRSAHLLLLASTLLVGCGDGTSAADPGELTLLITDDPGDFTQAIVDIERVELIGEGEPIVVNQQPFTRDLLTLSNDIAELAENVTIPGGSYSQVRFVIPAACIGVEQDDGSELIYASDGFEDCGDPAGSLRLPSFDESGLKVNLPGGSVQIDGDSRVLVFDFDVSQSFGQEAGSSNSWVMHPVINAEELSFTGSIRVELTAAEGVDLAALGQSLASFQARLDDEPRPEAFTDEDEDGTWTATFFYVFPDETYTVTLELQEGIVFDFTSDPTSPQDVTVESASQETVAFVVTSAGAP